MRLIWAALILTVGSVAAQAGDFRLAVTTSFQNSGLADTVIPAAEAATGFEIDVLVTGTGQALRLGQVGDVDAVIVHAPEKEAAFVADGHAPYRREIMFNTFVLAGPAADPAGIGAEPSVDAAMSAIAGAETPFVSRGDESGTHVRERMLWEAAKIEPQGRWYREVGAGMGAALNIAAAMDAYILTDKASWLNFSNKRGLKLLFEGDPLLVNQYAFLPMTQSGNRELGRALERWFASSDGQAKIAALMVDGEALFVPNAQPGQGADR